MARKFTMSIPKAMYDALENERKKRKLDTIQQTIRFVISEYLRTLEEPRKSH